MLCCEHEHVCSKENLELGLLSWAKIKTRSPSKKISPSCTLYCLYQHWVTPIDIFKFIDPSLLRASDRNYGVAKPGSVGSNITVRSGL